MPVIIKPMRLGIMTKVEPQKSGGTFVVTALGLFRLHDPSDFMSDQALWPMAAKELPPGTVLDIGSAKVQGDILLGGHAAAPQGQTAQAMTVGVAMAGKTVTLAVFGDRYWMPTRNGAVFTEPKPFEVMPITPDRAFGGPGHPRNPAGRGFQAAKRIVDGEAVLLPNVEYRDDLLRHVDRTPRPALVGPINLASPERTKLAGTYDNNWLKNYFPGLPPDADPHIYNAAPPEQRIDGYFAEDAPFHAVGMSAQHPDVTGALPGFRVRCLLDRTSSPVGLNELQMRIDTVWFFAGEGVGVAVYRGATAIADPDALDIKGVLLAYERMHDAPRPTAHYAEVMAARVKREPDMKFLMPDAMLSPPPDPEEEARKLRLREVYNQDLVTKFHEAQIWMAQKKAAEAGIPPALMPDIPRPDPLPVMLPTPDEIERSDFNLAELIDGLERHKQETLGRFGPVFEKLKTKGAEAMVRDPASTLDMLLPPEEAQQIKEQLQQITSPPDFAAMTEIGVPEDVQERLDEVKALFPLSFDRFGTSPEEDEKVFDEACERFATSAAAQAFGAIRKSLDPSALGQIPAVPAGAGESIGALSLIDSMANIPPEVNQKIDADLQASGAKLGGQSPTLESILSSIDLPPSPSKNVNARDLQQHIGQQFEAANEALDDNQPRFDEGLGQLRRISPAPSFPPIPLSPTISARFGAHVMSRFAAGDRLAGRDMAGADLRGADFSGMDLTGAFFERADLTGAKLTQAQCAKAVFTSAKLDEVDLSGADLSEANLSEVTARNASFRSARMDKIATLNTNFTCADLSGVSLTDTNLTFVRMASAKLQGAKVTKVNFVKGILDNVDASGAEFEQCIFLEGSLVASRFSSGRLFRTIFLTCNAPGINMENANLERAIFLNGTDFTGGRFAGASGFKSTWHASVLIGASFAYGSFDQATFSEADLSRTSFRLASLKQSLFGSAKMSGADLFGANLLEAQLRRANLSGASLRSANLYSADLTMAEMNAADFSGANYGKTYLEMLPTDAN